ncbi:MAG: hypothetical protein QXG65_03250 [Thermoplasmata archaeon]
MSVHGAAIADRVRPLLAGRPGADALFGQLRDGMPDQEYGAMAITRLISLT